MAEKDRTLEEQLTTLAADLDYPPTPHLAPVIRARIEPRRAAVRWRRPWLVAAAAILLAIALGVAAVPQARQVVAGWLGIRGVNIQRVQHPPVPPARPNGPIGERLDLGEPVSLSEAGRKAGFKVLVPAALGPPDESFYNGKTGAVTLVYYPRAGLPEAHETGAGALVTEFKGTVQGPILSKAIGPGTQLQQTDVNGSPAYWISGAPHDVFYTDPGGAFRQDTLRLATNTLLWQRGDITYRLEATTSLDEARRIAGSLS